MLRFGSGVVALRRLYIKILIKSTGFDLEIHNP